MMNFCHRGSTEWIPFRFQAHRYPEYDSFTR